MAEMMGRNILASQTALERALFVALLSLTRTQAIEDDECKSTDGSAVVQLELHLVKS